MAGSELRAGAARISIAPPLDLPMIGFVRQRSGGTGYGLPLEATALAFARGETRVVLCGVDVCFIGQPEIDVLCARIAEATGAGIEGILVNTQHTHLAPPGGVLQRHMLGDVDDDLEAAVEAWVRGLHDRIASVCRLAFERLEPARVAWAVGEVDETVNRRERIADGRTVLGWSPDAMLDRQVTSLQARRPDGSAIATLVGFGCHPVTTGYDMSIYSSDYPGALREAVRANGGGECVFFQAASGNVLPRVSFTLDEREAGRVGRRIALEALRSLADQPAGERRAVAVPEASMVPIIAYRVEEQWGDPPELSATHDLVELPLQPFPSPAGIADLRAEYAADLVEARASGDPGRVRVALVGALWAENAERAILAGARAVTPARLHAVRIGDGVIATAPGETFTEIGLSVKERSPGRPTLYCGYTNGFVGYLPIASEYPYGGYEPVLGTRGSLVPSMIDAAADRILVERGVRLVERLFPGAPAWKHEEGWLASGDAPALPAPVLTHPGGPGVPGESPVAAMAARRS
jgi:neutral ceramidase